MAKRHVRVRGTAGAQRDAPSEDLSSREIEYFERLAASMPPRSPRSGPIPDEIKRIVEREAIALYLEGKGYDMIELWERIDRATGSACTHHDIDRIFKEMSSESPKGAAAKRWEGMAEEIIRSRGQQP